MMRKYNSLISLLLLAVISTASWGFEELTDQQMNAVTAGSTDASHASTEALNRIPFRYAGRKGNVDGEVVVVPMATYNQNSSMLLSGNAQSHLQSLININAVNSPVQVLLNLNISVNSNIGNINQLNGLMSNLPR